MCVCGATQNQNECLNSLVWAWCPKHKYHGIKFVHCAMASAVCHFHSGAATREKVLKKLSTPAGEHTREHHLPLTRKECESQICRQPVKRRQGEAGLQT